MIRERGWECFATYENELTATVVVNYLQQNDCPSAPTR
jgi:hypothetical protein